MMFRRYVWGSLFLMTLETSAQLAPVYNVPSPEISSLGTYRNIPVGHYTGVPEISIPLYEVKIGKYSLPITASYHLASVKPDSQYGSLGLGWSLYAGGYITRTVNFQLDEKYKDETTHAGFYYHATEMKDISTAAYFANVNIGESDLSADEFCFNFCGYSGYFYYNADNGWTVVSDDDIKIVFDEQNGGIITNKNTLLTKRVYMTNWANNNMNTHYFNQFTLITPDGCQYEFGGVNATEYSISYYNRDNSDLIPTTWRLSKITTTDGRTIQFSYRTDGLLCDLRYAPQYVSFNAEVNVGFHSWPFFNDDWQPDGEATYATGLAGFTGFLIFPVNIETIKTDNETISFSYMKDSQYGSRFLHDRRVLYHEYNNACYYDFHGYGAFNPTNQFFSLLKVSKGSTPYQTQNLIAQKLQCYLLSNISIKKKYGGCDQSIALNYTMSNRPKLARIEHTGMLVMGNDTTISSKLYQFSYNTSKMPTYFVYPATDSWGYYSGTDIVISDDPTYSIATPNENATKAETLTEITYPTGGKTRFTYELNRYSKVVDDNHVSLKSKTGIAGGLRVAEVKDYDENGALVRQKKYYYSENVSGSPSSGILKAMPSFEVNLHLPDDGKTFRDAHLVHKSQGGFWPTAHHESSPYVGYSTVIEEIIGSDGLVQGYVKYRYSNYDSDIYGIEHGNDSAFYFSSSQTEMYGVASPYASKAMERGRLQSVEYFAANGTDMVKKINYRYGATQEQSMVSSFQHWMVFNYRDNRYVYPLGWLVNTPMYSCHKTLETDTVYTSGGTPFSTHKTFTYNNHKLLKRTTENTSYGGSRSTTILYPSDDAAYSWMTNRHILNPVVAKTVSEQSHSISDQYSYASKDGVPYISSYEQVFDGSHQKTIFKVNVADKYGNPVEYESGGMKSVLFWGRKGQLFLGRIDNLSYQESQSLTAPNYEDADPSYCYGLERNLMFVPATAHLYAYGYNGDNLLQSTLQPTGFMTFYKYDSFGRLRETYHYDDTPDEIVKRVLDIYDYHYYSE